jgi:hypothetical protein
VHKLKVSSKKLKLDRSTLRTLQPIEAREAAGGTTSTAALTTTTIPLSWASIAWSVEFCTSNGGGGPTHGADCITMRRCPTEL